MNNFVVSTQQKEHKTVRIQLYSVNLARTLVLGLRRRERKSERKLCVALCTSKQVQNCNRQWTSESFIYFHQSFCLSALTSFPAGLHCFHSVCLLDCLSVCQWVWCGQQTILWSWVTEEEIALREEKQQQKERRGEMREWTSWLRWSSLSAHYCRQNKRDRLPECTKWLSHTTVQFTRCKFSGLSPAPKTVIQTPSFFFPLASPVYLMRRFIHLQCTQNQKAVVEKLMPSFFEQVHWNANLPAFFYFLSFFLFFVSPFSHFLIPSFFAEEKNEFINSWLHENVSLSFSGKIKNRSKHNKWD